MQPDSPLSKLPDNKHSGDKTLPSDETDNGSGRVSFTTKELLADISKKIDQVNDKLDKKVDRSELEVLTTRIIVLETKRAASDALKVQSEQMEQIYLRQFEAMQNDIHELQTGQATSSAIQKDKDNWKILWVPVIVNSLGIIALITFQFIK